MTANNSKIKTDSIADWYNSCSKRIESLSKKLAEAEYPTEVDFCPVCEIPIKYHIDQWECCYRCGEEDYFFCYCDGM